MRRLFGITVQSPDMTYYLGRYFVYRTEIDQLIAEVLDVSKYQRKDTSRDVFVFVPRVDQAKELVSAIEKQFGDKRCMGQCFIDRVEGDAVYLVCARCGEELVVDLNSKRVSIVDAPGNTDYRCPRCHHEVFDEAMNAWTKKHSEDRVQPASD